MSIKRSLIVLAAVLVLALPSEGSRSIITVNYPPDNIVIEYNLLSVSLSVPQEFAGSIRVNVNSEERTEILSDGRFKCFSVSLVPGVNRIDISALEGDEIADAVTFSVFRRSDIISQYRVPPSGFKKDFFHMEERSICTPCHTLEATDADRTPVNIATFSGSSADGKDSEPASTCYSCHKGIMSDPYVHGPASVWSCLSCHEPDSTPKYSVEKPDAKACFKCHTEQEKLWKSRKFIHGPVNMGNCTICHSPHSSKYPFNLFKSSWDLCVNCHAEKATGQHVLGDAMYPEGHPTRGRPDPVREGKELSCASCHEPHASDFPHLWAFEVESLFDLCQKCHNK